MSAASPAATSKFAALVSSHDNHSSVVARSRSIPTVSEPGADRAHQLASVVVTPHEHHQAGGDPTWRHADQPEVIRVFELQRLLDGAPVDTATGKEFTHRTMDERLRQQRPIVALAEDGERLPGVVSRCAEIHLQRAHVGQLGLDPRREARILCGERERFAEQTFTVGQVLLDETQLTEQPQRVREATV